MKSLTLLSKHIGYAVTVLVIYLFVGAHPSLALPTLVDVRVGPHKRFDRVVFEFQGEVANRMVTRLNQKVEVRFSDIAIRPGLSLPRLPLGLSVLSGLNMEKRGATGVVFTLALVREAVPSELTLTGDSWRLAVDLTPQVAETHEEKPEYIPGDLPIPTIFGEAEEPEDSLPDPTQALAILSFYYLAQGDTPAALRHAEAYRNVTGDILDIGITAPSARSSTLKVPASQIAQKSSSPELSLRAYFSRFGWAFLTITFAAGFLVGVYASRFYRAVKLPGFRFSLKRAPKSPKALATEMEQNLMNLREAVEKETKQSVPPAPKDSSPAPEVQTAPSLEPVAIEEDQIRESLMDRRVKRVLELAREGRNLASIAEELEMGQDEVKLILDLNQ